MLYLVKREVKGGYPLPPEEYLGLVAKDLEAIMKYKEEGKVLMHGTPIGRAAGYTIYDVDSNDELQRLYARLPLFPFVETEIIPLISESKMMPPPNSLGVFTSHTSYNNP